MTGPSRADRLAQAEGKLAMARAELELTRRRLERAEATLTMIRQWLAIGAKISATDKAVPCLVRRDDGTYSGGLTIAVPPVPIVPLGQEPPRQDSERDLPEPTP